MDRERREIEEEKGRVQMDKIQIQEQMQREGETQNGERMAEERRNRE